MAILNLFELTHFSRVFFVYSRLEGKVAIITGGASGIGEATARLFVENGAFVVIGDIQDDLGNQLAHDLGSQVAIYKHCDVTIESDMEELVALALSKWGKLDIMYSNAGIVGKIDKLDEMQCLNMENFDHVMNVNVRGMALALKNASRAMIDSKTRGVIICTASTSSVVGGTTHIEYTTSKHAVLGLMRAATSNLGKYGIRVNCVSPSVVVTPLSLNFFKEVTGNHANPEHEIKVYNDSTNVLCGHTLLPIDIAQAVLYLASDDAAFVSGLNLIVDGGITATYR